MTLSWITYREECKSVGPLQRVPNRNKNNYDNFAVSSAHPISPLHPTFPSPLNSPTSPEKCHGDFFIEDSL